jgi:hypothetical protein
MMALFGFAVGYVVGVQQGKEGMARLIQSWQQIQGSEEFAAAMESGKEMIVGLLKQAFDAGTGMLSGEVKGAVNRRLRVA